MSGSVVYAVHVQLLPTGARACIDHRVHLVCSVALTGTEVKPVQRRPGRSAGVRLWFTDSGGAGAAVVFVHAATGSSRVWEYQRPAFSARGYRVITYDRRGYGRSVADPSGASSPGPVPTISMR